MSLISVMMLIVGGDRYTGGVADVAFAWCKQTQIWKEKVNIEHSDNWKECIKNIERRCLIKVFHKRFRHEKSQTWHLAG